MIQRRGLVFASTCCLLLLVVCFAGLAQQASAAGISGTIQFCDEAGTHRTSYVLGETGYYTVVCSGGSYPSFFEYTVKNAKRAVVGSGGFDPPGGYAMDSFGISLSGPTGTWSATLRYFDDYTLRYKTISGDSATVSAPTSNSPPTAKIDLITPSPAVQGKPVDFYGTGADSDGTVTQYSWRSNLDGTLGGTEDLLATSLQTVGTHTITFRVTDNLGAWTEDSRQLVVNAAPPNNPPTASFSIVPTPAYVGVPVDFLGTASDSDGTIVSYSWTSNLYGLMGTTKDLLGFSNLQLGTHTIAFAVMDDDGATTGVSQQLVVLSGPPLVDKSGVSVFSDATGCDPTTPVQENFGNHWHQEWASLTARNASILARATSSLPFVPIIVEAEASVWKMVMFADTGTYHVVISGHYSGSHQCSGTGWGDLMFEVFVKDAVDGSIQKEVVLDDLWLGTPYIPQDVNKDIRTSFDWQPPLPYHAYSIGVRVYAYSDATAGLDGETGQTVTGKAVADAYTVNSANPAGIWYDRISIYRGVTLFADDFSSVMLPESRGWSMDQSAGGVSIDKNTYCVTPASLRLIKSDYNGVTSASHGFESVVTSGNVIVEFNIMETVTNGFAMVYVMGGDTYQVNFAIYGGMFRWFPNIGQQGWLSTGVSASPNIWYHVVLSIDVNAAKFSMVIDGQFAKTGDFYTYYPAVTHYLDRVHFETGQGYATPYKTVWIDNVVVRKAKPLVCDDLKDTKASSGAHPAWTLDGSGGSAGLDTSTNAPYGFSKPSLLLFRDGADTTGGSSATAIFPAQSVHVYAEARIMISAASYYDKWSYFLLRDSSGNTLVYFAFIDGQLKWWNGGVWNVWHDTGFAYEYSHWYKVGLDVDIAAKTYDIYVDGVPVYGGASFYYQGSSIDRVCFQSSWNGNGQTVYTWIDDVLITT